MDFETALRILEKSTGESRSARYPGRLDRMRTLLSLLGNPEQKFRAVHVGGTAGKGSTATMIASILSAAGNKVGLHTKPHLHSVTERARIGTVPIGEQQFADIFSELLPIIDEMRYSQWGPPSYFELLVALAFQYFALEAVEVAVIEVGVGGTLDGTNVITPLVSVITNVGTDHRDVLGDTVEAIARDKSGIIKPGVPVVTAAEQPEVLEIIGEAAVRNSAPLVVQSSALELSSTANMTPFSQSVGARTANDSYSFVLPLLGEYQAVNAGTAILASERIRSRFPTTSQNVERALSQISLPGRTEYYPSRPALLFDVAHNIEKAAALAQAIRWHFGDRRLVFVAALAEEKDALGVLRAWQNLPAQFVFTSFDVSHRRSRHARNLVNMAEQFGMPARAVDDPKEALAVARRIASSDDLVVVTGSTFLVSILRQWFLNQAGAAPHVHA